MEVLAVHFDDMFESCVVGLRKPDLNMFRHVLTTLGVPAERALYLDDIPANVKAARLVGITSIRVPGGRPGAYRQMFNDLYDALADIRVAIPTLIINQEAPPRTVAVVANSAKL